MPDESAGVTQTNDAANQSAGKDGQGAGSGRAFSQEDVNRIVEERLARERAKYADYDGLKAAKAELEKIKQSQMSETEKLTKAASDNERRAIAAESRIAQMEIRADFVEKAVTAGVTDIKLAYLAAQAEGLLGAYDADKGVGKHDFTELKKRYPNLFRPGAGGSADGGAGGQAAVSGKSMNAFIRAAAGRG